MLSKQGFLGAWKKSDYLAVQWVFFELQRMQKIVL